MNAHTPPPEGPQEPLYRRTDISPEQFFQALGRLRRAARDEIERLIQWLDSTIDVDEDMAVDDEPCDDRELEPSLGSFDRMSDQIKAWRAITNGCDVDAELDTSDDEPDAGSEPEEENEHHDGFAECEPSLGWPEQIAQGQGVWGGTDDRELAAGPAVDAARRQRHLRTDIGNVGPIIAEWQVL